MGLFRILILYFFLVVMNICQPATAKTSPWYLRLAPHPLFSSHPPQPSASEHLKPSQAQRPIWLCLVVFLSSNCLCAGGQPP